MIGKKYYYIHQTSLRSQDNGDRNTMSGKVKRTINKTGRTMYLHHTDSEKQYIETIRGVRTMRFHLQTKQHYVEMKKNIDRYIK